jgi:hypothetical protein
MRVRVRVLDNADKELCGERILNPGALQDVARIVQHGVRGQCRVRERTANREHQSAHIAAAVHSGALSGRLTPSGQQRQGAAEAQPCDHRRRGALDVGLGTLGMQVEGEPESAHAAVGARR